MTPLAALLTFLTRPGDEIRVCDSCSITWRGPFPCWCCAGLGTVIYPTAAEAKA